MYCLSRRKVEETAEWLAAHGVNALPYHAGMEHAERSANQDRFQREEQRRFELLLEHTDVPVWVDDLKKWKK